MDSESINKLAKLDNAVAELANGAYVLPYKSDVNFDYAKMLEYCEERGIDPNKLTDDELKLFETPRKRQSAA